MVPSVTTIRRGLLALGLEKGAAFVRLVLQGNFHKLENGLSESPVAGLLLSD